MDIFVEPVLPRPSLLIFGASPVALALAEQARPLGFHVTVAAPAADLAEAPDADMLIDGFALDPVRRGAALRRRLDAGQGRRGRAQGGARHRRRLPRLRRQPPQDGGAARTSSSPTASTPAPSTASRRRPASTSAPSRRKKSRCRSSPRSSVNAAMGKGARRRSLAPAPSRLGRLTIGLLERWRAPQFLATLTPRRLLSSPHGKPVEPRGRLAIFQHQAHARLAPWAGPRLTMRVAGFAALFKILTLAIVFPNQPPDAT